MPDVPGHELSVDDLIKRTLLKKLLEDESNGFKTKQEAYDAALKAGIKNPGVVTRDNEFFFTDQSVTPPDRTFSTKFEAEQFGASIGRADLVAVFDSAIGAHRLEEPPSSTPTGEPRWIPEIGKFEVTLSDGQQKKLIDLKGDPSDDKIVQWVQEILDREGLELDVQSVKGDWILQPR